MKVRIQKGKLETFACDLLALKWVQGQKMDGSTGAVDRALRGLVSGMLKAEEFKGKEGETLVFAVGGGKIAAKKIMILGLGPQKNVTPDLVRKSAARIVKEARRQKAKRVGTLLIGTGTAAIDPFTAAKAMTEGALLSGYAYTKYKSAAARQEAARPGELVIITSGTHNTARVLEEEKFRAAAKGVREGEIFARAAILARDLVNEPASNMVPKDLAETAVKIVQDAGGVVHNPKNVGPGLVPGRGGAQGPALRGDKGLSVQILNRAQCEKLGMGAYLGVAKGSDHEPYFLHLVWKPDGTGGKAQITRRVKKIAIVGKGITFDSGGLSLKPSQHMETMQNDMSGCAAVLGVFQALAKMKPNIEVHGISAVCENMPSGRAMKPGDIVRTMAGKTIEVLNTDAEGRLTLADALSYAVKHIKPDAIVDLATLTGACIVALGEEVAGAMSNNQQFMDNIRIAADRAGEYIWQLPLPEEYKESIKSHVADYVNITPGRKGAGAITAGLLLAEFVGKIPWVHLDIAGPAWAEKDVIPHMPKGGTGFGVRTMLELLKDFEKA